MLLYVRCASIHSFSHHYSLRLPYTLQQATDILSKLGAAIDPSAFMSSLFRCRSKNLLVEFHIAINSSNCLRSCLLSSLRYPCIMAGHDVIVHWSRDSSRLVCLFVDAWLVVFCVSVIFLHLFLICGTFPFFLDVERVQLFSWYYELDSVHHLKWLQMIRSSYTDYLWNESLVFRLFAQ